MLAFSALQAAVFKALAGEPTLAALVGARIFDDVPHESEATSTAFPRVTIGEQSSDYAGTSDSDLFEVEIIIHAWSRAPGRTECLNLIGAIFRALHRQSLPATAGYIVGLDYAGHETVKEADGETYHATIRFAGLMQTS